MAIQRAILSVTDKEKIDYFGKELQALGIEILSTGGTAKTLRNAGVQVTEVADHTKFPECLDDRVKTLHPLIHGGILYDRTNPQHVEEAASLGIRPIDMVVVNLYPFEKVAANPNATLQELIKNMDIGGPTMLNSAIKNGRQVAVITDPTQYEPIISELKQNGTLSQQTMDALAAIAINRVADYRSANATALTEKLTGEKTLRQAFRQGQQLGRYGENWHQKAWLYLGTNQGPNIAHAQQLHGPALGFNNYLDATAALEAVKELTAPGTVVVKHTNPCGMATGTTTLEALERAWQGDTTSAFGSILAFNRTVDIEVVKALTERPNVDGKKGWFFEVMIAPDYTPEAIEYIKSKTSKERTRILKVNNFDNQQNTLVHRAIPGGILVQERDDQLYLPEEGRAGTIDDTFKQPHTVECPNTKERRVVGAVTKFAPEEQLTGRYDFAWRAAKHVKSNAIVIAREYAPGKYQILGMGAGQPNRLESAKLAANMAMKNIIEEYKIMTEAADPYHTGILTTRTQIPKRFEEYRSQELAKCAAASDAFFPKPDALQELLVFGIKHFITPGGAKQDDLIVETANQDGATMVYTGTRHFRH